MLTIAKWLYKAVLSEEKNSSIWQVEEASKLG